MEQSRELTILVRRSIRGDAVAFEGLVERFGADIIYNVNRLLDVKADTEDVAQEVVIKLHRYIPTLRSPYAFYSYLYKLTKRICYRHNEQTSRRAENDIEDYSEVLADDEVRQPEKQFEQKDTERQVLELLNQLPESQREALYLHYYKDFSYKEIAEVLGVTTNTVGSNISRAKEALRQMLEQKENNFDINRKGSGDVELFGGLAIAPLLQGVFASDIASKVSPDSLTHLQAAAVSLTAAAAVGKGAFAASQSVGKGAGKVAAKSVATKATVALVTAVAAATVVSVGVKVTQTAQTPQLSPAAITQQQEIQNSALEQATPPAFNPKANISFRGDSSSPEHVNPTSAKLTVSGGNADRWQLLSSGGDVIASGKGSTAKFAGLKLTDGKYRVSWEITGEGEQIANASREFYVKG